MAYNAIVCFRYALITEHLTDLYNTAIQDFGFRFFNTWQMALVLNFHHWTSTVNKHRTAKQTSINTRRNPGNSLDTCHVTQGGQANTRPPRLLSRLFSY